VQRSANVVEAFGAYACKVCAKPVNVFVSGLPWWTNIVYTIALTAIQADMN